MNSINVVGYGYHAMVEETTTNQTDENVLPDESELKFPEKEFLDKMAKSGWIRS